MSGNSTYLGNALINWTRGTAMPTVPSAVYVALFNGDPTDAGNGGTEVTTTIRVAGRVAATFGAASNKNTFNQTAVDFGNAAGPTTVTHFAVFDAASAGNMLASNALTSGAGAITISTPVSFALGALNWTS